MPRNDANVLLSSSLPCRVVILRQINDLNSQGDAAATIDIMAQYQNSQQREV
jgi:hypothetical protein